MSTLANRLLKPRRFGNEVSTSVPFQSICALLPVCPSSCVKSKQLLLAIRPPSVSNDHDKIRPERSKIKAGPSSPYYFVNAREVTQVSLPWKGCHPRPCPRYREGSTCTCRVISKQILHGIRQHISWGKEFSWQRSKLAMRGDYL